MSSYPGDDEYSGLPSIEESLPASEEQPEYSDPGQGFDAAPDELADSPEADPALEDPGTADLSVDQMLEAAVLEEGALEAMDLSNLAPPPLVPTFQLRLDTVSEEQKTL